MMTENLVQTTIKPEQALSELSELAQVAIFLTAYQESFDAADLEAMRFLRSRSQGVVLATLSRNTEVGPWVFIQSIEKRPLQGLLAWLRALEVTFSGPVDPGTADRCLYCVAPYVSSFLKASRPSKPENVADLRTQASELALFVEIARLRFDRRHAAVSFFATDEHLYFDLWRRSFAKWLLTSHSPVFEGLRLSMVARDDLRHNFWSEAERAQFWTEEYQLRLELAQSRSRLNS